MSEYDKLYYAINKDKIKEKHKSNRKKNPEKAKEDSRRYYKNSSAAKVYREANKEIKKEYTKIWHENNKERRNAERRTRYAANKVNESEKNKLYYQRNKNKRVAWCARREASKSNATPKWLTKEHWKEIENFYTLAQELAWLNQDGKPFHVDHIVPLQGKNICGLHVPWNLQLLPAKENISKGNRL